MNNRERMLKTFQHEEPDRVLVHHRGIFPNGTFYQNWMESVADTLEDADMFIIPNIGDLTLPHWCAQDTVYGGVPSLVGYPKVNLMEEIEGNLTHPILDHLKHVPDKSKLRIESNGSIEEMRSLNNMNYNWYHDGFFRSEQTRKDFYAKHGTPTEDRFRPTEKHFDQLQKQLKTLEEMDYPVVMICESGSFWEYFFEGTGIGAAGYAMRKNPEYVRKVMDDAFKMTEFAWKMMLDAGAEVVGIADDLGQKGHGLLSTAQWNEFIRPRFSELMDLAHKHGAFTEMHQLRFYRRLFARSY